MRALGTTAIAACLGVWVLSGCTTQSYCFNGCDEGTSGSGANAGGSSNGGDGGANQGGSGGFIIFDSGLGGSSGGGGSGPCTQTNGGIEACDGLDNDCNGQIDELFDLTADPRNCGVCKNDCTLQVKGAEQAKCTATAGTPGTCGYTTCAQDYFDVNAKPEDGCEYYCAKRGDTDETCDNIDDNCNGKYDDGIDLCTDVKNCGKCGRNCQSADKHATTRCVADSGGGACNETNTACEVAKCDPGWIDANKLFADGCEYPCKPSKRTNPSDAASLVECDPDTDSDCGKREYCDGKDNDCDGTIDGMDSDMLDPNKGDPTLGITCVGSTNGQCGEDAHKGLNRCVSGEVKCLGNNTGNQVCTGDHECNDPARPYCIDSPNPPQKVCGTKVLQVGESPELCDKIDNNCDTVIDDDPKDVGGACGSNLGWCRQGKFICTEGVLTCSGAREPLPETCNGLDDNCDGVLDGTAAVPPVVCQNDVDCASVVGGKFCLPRSMGGKVCAALPSDITDAAGNPKPCDEPQPPPAGWNSSCQAGVYTCASGVALCVGSVKPSASTDVCGEDRNCDGIKSPDFNLQTDVKNCGSCGYDCFARKGGFINWMCSAGQCVPDPNQKCMTGYIDCDGNGLDCERPCTFQSDKELCNSIDDNCNCQLNEVKSAQYPNGIELPSPTQVCGISPAVQADSVCATQTTVSCQAGKWTCQYPPDHCSGGSCVATTDICDGKDNNCNGNFDENFKQPVLATGYLGQACASDDTTALKHGVCQQRGTFQCSGTNATSCQNIAKQPIANVPLACGTGAGQSGEPCDEACDGKDNDCDGSVDESFRDKGGNLTYFVKPSVMQVGSEWIYRYEASRPLSSATSAGSGNGWWRRANMVNAATQPVPPAGTTLDQTPSCSAVNRVPWFNISGPEAQHVCVEMGGYLCKNSHWQQACRSNTTSCTWGFASQCTQFSAGQNWTTCNLGPYDFSSSAGNQDGLLPTGYLGDCRSVWPANGSTSIFDITGNLREITCPGSANCTASSTSFVLMGGAFNTADPTGEGARCNFDFYSVDSAFKLYDVGFRCCFSSNPTL